MNLKNCLRLSKIMNRELTIVFNSYQSQHLLSNVIKKINKNYKILIIENSLQLSVKISLEKKFKNVEVVIPKTNLGLAKSYNLAIQKSRTKYVFLNNPDLEITNQSIKSLLECAKKIKKFGIIAPSYRSEKNFKNYEIFSKKKNKQVGVFKKFKIIEVDLIDNNFLVEKKTITKNPFDENYFLFFETFDFSKNLKKKNFKLYISKKIKFHHYGSSSIHPSFNNLVKKTRAFHYNWSKYYFLKKNYNYILAIKKIFPNFKKAIFGILINLLKLNFKKMYLGFLELLGIVTSILNLKSFYRPNN